MSVILSTWGMRRGGRRLMISLLVWLPGRMCLLGRGGGLCVPGPMSLCWGGGSPRGGFCPRGLCQGDPPYGEEWAVHIPLECYLVTACKQSCGKVMFLHLSVSHSVHRVVSAGSEGVCLWVQGAVHLPGNTQTPLDTDNPGHPQSTSGRYASCWNAFSVKV